MKVIVAIDQTSNRNEVLHAVLCRHWPKDVSIKLLTVIEPFPWADLEKMQKIASDLLESAKVRAEEALLEARSRIERAHPYASVHVELKVGDPRVEIVDCAAQWGADRIVIGAHGTSPNRLLPCRLGPTIARRATCSIELVRLKDTDEMAAEVPARRQKVEVEGALGI